MSEHVARAKFQLEVDTKLMSAIDVIADTNSQTRAEFIRRACRLLVFLETEVDPSEGIAVKRKDGRTQVIIPGI